jgi:hypothetical protein
MDKTPLLDCVHYLNYKFIKLQRFGSWILLQSSGKKGGKGQGTYLFGLVLLNQDLRLA